MRRVGLLSLLVLGLGACGASGGPSIHLTMTQALAAEVETIYIVSMAGSRACPDLVVERSAIPSYGFCTGGDPEAGPPCVFSKATVKVLEIDLQDPITLYVPAGSRTIVAVGLDAGDSVVAFACRGPITVDAGKRTDVDLELK